MQEDKKISVDDIVALVKQARQRVDHQPAVKEKVRALMAAGLPFEAATAMFGLVETMRVSAIGMADDTDELQHIFGGMMVGLIVVSENPPTREQWVEVANLVIETKGALPQFTEEELA